MTASAGNSSDGVSTDARPTGPLVGVRILDLTSIVIGPYPMKLLGDMGADIIKVESPEGDWTRAIGPRRSPGMSAQFLNLNSNKRSVVLNLKSEEGREAFLRLAATCDAVVTNVRPQAIESLGLTYADVLKVNAEIIYCRIAGFRSDGANRNKPAIDDVIQSMSGMVALQDDLGGKPTFSPIALADAVCGLVWMSGLLAALYRRATSGGGEEIELPMYETMSSFVLATHMSGSIFEPPLGPPLYPRSISPERKPYATSDGLLCVSPYSDAHWRRFLSVIDMEHLLEEPRFATVYDRASHLNELYALMTKPMAAMSTAALSAKLDAADIPYAPVQTTAQMLADLEQQDDGIIQILEHPTEGTLRLVGNPLRFKNNPCNIHELPNRIGERSRDILREAGYADNEIDEFVEKGISATP